MADDRVSRTATRLVVLNGTLWLCAGCASTRYIDPKADGILRQMSDTLARADAFSVDVRTTRDELIPGGPMVEFTASSTIKLRRPSQLHTSSRGQGRNRAAWFSGGRLTILDKARQLYASLETKRKIDDMLDDMLDEYDVEMPAADLLFSNPYDVLTENVRSGEYIGLHRAGGHDCHHLAFRQETIDWQIWIGADGDALPYRFVITFLEMTGQPETQVEFANWDLSPRLSAGQFLFHAPAEARSVDMDDLFADAGVG